ncbi:MAG: hypothetical protein ABL921_09650 [Pirellula sp.]
MTELKRSIFVIPSSSLDDLPKAMGHEMALDFLTAWTSQWDPRLLSAMGGLPEWKRADGASLDLEDALLVCPNISKPPLDQPLRERLELNRCRLLNSDSQSRSELVASLVECVSPESLTKHPCPLLLEDFYALGYAVLQVQILARKLRYSWNIDWIMFTEQAISAANASLADDAIESERWLQTCFDSLSQERDRYCSQQAYLLDVVLLASTTVGSSLEKQLESKHPISIIATSRLLQSIKERNPTAFSKIKECVAAKSVSLVGGLDTERMHPYTSAHSIIHDLKQGLRSYAQLGVSAPKIFTRYAPGFTATMPTWLTQFGYTGAILAAWSDGSVPTNDQAKVKWQASSDGSSLDTVVGNVMDASSADTYIDLAEALSRQLDYHHVPTIVLAHWPGKQPQPWCDLLRVIERSPALGKLHTAESYFSSTNSPYSSDSFPNGAFKVPIPDSVPQQNKLHAAIVQQEHLRVRLERLESLWYLWTQVAGGSMANHESLAAATHQINNLHSSIDAWFDNCTSNTATESDITELQQRLDSHRQLLLERICEVLTNQASKATGRPESNGYVVVNPSNHSLRCYLEDIVGNVDKDSCPRMVAAESRAGKSTVIVDVPPYGFVKFASTPSRASQSNAEIQVPKASVWSRISGKRLGIADTDWTLANEFFEIQIDPKKGHLRSLYIANKRGSRLSGMTSIVQGNPSAQRKWDERECLEPIDVQLRIVRTTPLVGIIESVASFKQLDGRVARVTTTYKLWKGTRWIQIDVDGENLSQDQNACVWRTAWLNESSTVSAWHHGIKGKLQSPLQNTVELIEIDDAEHKIFFATGGLSSHRRSELRFLISQIPIDVNGRARGTFALGMDWPRPYETAMDLLDRPWLIGTNQSSGASSDTSAWLAQCNLSNVNFYFSDPTPALQSEMMSIEEADLLAGRQGDVCLWLQETQGKSGAAKMSFFKDVAEAWRVDSQGREYASLPVSDGQLVFSVNANEQSRILLRWKQDSSLSNS